MTHTHTHTHMHHTADTRQGANQGVCNEYACVHVRADTTVGTTCVVVCVLSLQVARAVGAWHVFCNRRYEPASLEVDDAVFNSLAALGFQVQTYNAALLRYVRTHPPTHVHTRLHTQIHTNTCAYTGQRREA